MASVSSGASALLLPDAIPRHQRRDLMLQIDFGFHPDNAVLTYFVHATAQRILYNKPTFFAVVEITAQKGVDVIHHPFRCVRLVPAGKEQGGDRPLFTTDGDHYLKDLPSALDSLKERLTGFDIEDSMLQQVMDVAYARWQKNEHWSMQQFWEQLSEQETFVVHMGKLNQQVCNGGFEQWLSNGYGTNGVMTYLMPKLREIGTPAAKAVANMIAELYEALNDEEVQDDDHVFENGTGAHCDECGHDHDVFDTDKIDTAFYKVNEELMRDADAFLWAWMQDKKVAA
jgi:hypothetical protein